MLIASFLKNKQEPAQKKSQKSIRGFTLLEIVFYVALLMIIVVAVFNSVFSETSAWGHARAFRNAADSGRLIMDRLVQEMQLARSVNVASSVLGSHPGKLVLDTFASATSTQESTLEIFLDGGELKIKKGEEAPLSLSGQDVQITQLVFHHLSSPKSQIVRVQMTLQASQGKFLKEETFTAASVLRGSY